VSGLRIPQNGTTRLKEWTCIYSKCEVDREPSKSKERIQGYGANLSCTFPLLGVAQSLTCRPTSRSDEVHCTQEFFLHRKRACCGVHPASCAVVTVGYYPGVKAFGALSWPITSSCCRILNCVELHFHCPTHLHNVMLTYIHTYIYTYLHIYILTYIHTYIYTFHGSIILSQDKRMWNKS
jgi:hypothetical protein